MKKTELLIEIFRNLLTNPKNIRRVVDENAFYARYLHKKYTIESLPVLDLDRLFPGFEQEITNYCYLEGSSLTIDIAFLRKLASEIPECSYFELGCWRGESLFNVAEVAKECTALSLSEEEMRQMGVSEDNISQNHFFTRDLKNLTTIGHNSLTYDFTRIKNRFDLLFIDGDHHYESVLSDTRNVLNLRKNENSIIVWHDYGFNPEMVRPEVLAGILDGLPKHLHQYLFHIGNTKCAALIIKDFGTLPSRKFPSVPEKAFMVKIKATPLKTENQP